MRRFTVLAALLAAAAIALAPAPLLAQEGEGEGEQEEEPEFNYITVTKFRVPIASDDRQTVMEWIDEVTMPTTLLNPNVLSYRLATHNWGSNADDIVIISEFDEWPNIEGDCPACEAWFEENQPEEGTPEREEWDAKAQTFFKYFGGHKDEIYVVNMSRAKN